MNKIKITDKQIGQRLDKFLSNSYKNISRSKIQKLIKDGEIVVNDKKVPSHYFLKQDDIISVDFDFKKDIKKINSSDFLFWDNKIKIISDTEEYLVINKPNGLIAHGAGHIKSYTLDDWLIKKYPNIKKIGENPVRPGIVHRLDKDVSGIMVIAKIQDSFDSLKKQFQKRKVEKEYTALVYGKTDKDEDEINFPIKRSSDGYKMAAVPEEKQIFLSSAKTGITARRAITEFKIFKRFINYTLLKIKIKTGRTHQIRVHMLAYGHPVVGDDLYNTKRTREQNKKLDLGRLFLVADKLSFYDLKGKLQIFKIGLPKELEGFLGKIK